MSYRRSRADAHQARAWRDFVRRNAALLQASGVPHPLYESREVFDDLLMHGYIDHHPDPTRFFVGHLSEEQRRALVRAVAHYLQAGFPSPIGGFMNAMKDEIFRRAGMTH